MSVFQKILRFLGIINDSFVGNEIDALWIEAKTRFPYLVQNIKDGIAAVENDDLTGGEKAVKVALEVLESAPHVLRQLPNAKAFFVHAVTQVFAASLDELREEAAELLGTL